MTLSELQEFWQTSVPQEPQRINGGGKLADFNQKKAELLTLLGNPKSVPTGSSSQLFDREDEPVGMLCWGSPITAKFTAGQLPAPTVRGGEGRPGGLPHRRRGELLCFSPSTSTIIRRPGRRTARRGLVVSVAQQISAFPIALPVVRQRPWTTSWMTLLLVLASRACADCSTKSAAVQEFDKMKIYHLARLHTIT